MARNIKSSYDISREFFNWSFENPEKIKPIHTALFFFIIDKHNRLGWKPKFGLPTQDTMESIGVKNKKQYLKALYELVEFGFIEMVQKSKSKWTSNIIALCGLEKEIDRDTALDKSTSMQLQQEEEQERQNPSINDYGNDHSNTHGNAYGNDHGNTHGNDHGNTHGNAPIDKPITNNQQPETKSGEKENKNRSLAGNNFKSRKRDSNKKKNPEILPNISDTRKALTFLYEEHRKRYENEFANQYRHKIDKPEKFVADFNYKYWDERRPLIADDIIARLLKFTRAWLDKQSTQSKKYSAKNPGQDMQATNPAYKRIKYHEN